MVVVKGKASLNCKPNQTQFYGCVQYTDQSFLSPSAKEKHALEKELYVPCYFRKISKAALLKEKRAQLWNHFLLFKIFYSGKKKQKGMKKKKKICSLLLTCSWDSASHPLRGMTLCARSRPLQPVRQAAAALPAQSPSCRRRLASAPHMLTASEDCARFGAALRLLEQGSKARGGQAVLSS